LISSKDLFIIFIQKQEKKISREEFINVVVQAYGKAKATELLQMIDTKQQQLLQQQQQQQLLQQQQQQQPQTQHATPQQQHLQQQFQQQKLQAQTTPPGQPTQQQVS
jgi:hypothetical protein